MAIISPLMMLRSEVVSENLLLVWLTNDSYANPQIMREICTCSYSRGSIYKKSRERPDTSRKWLILNNPVYTPLTKSSAVAEQPKRKKAEEQQVPDPALPCLIQRTDLPYTGGVLPSPQALFWGTTAQFSQWLLLHLHKHSSLAVRTEVSETKLCSAPSLWLPGNEHHAAGQALHPIPCTLLTNGGFAPLADLQERSCDLEDWRLLIRREQMNDKHHLRGCVFSIRH